MAERSFRAEVGRVLEALADGLAPFVDARMSGAMPGEEWILTAADRMGKRADVIVSATDPQFQLDVVHRFWGLAFASELDDRYRPIVDELRTARNHWAHFDDSRPIDLAYARRIHDLVEDLLRGIDAPEADEVADLLSIMELQALRTPGRDADAATDQLLVELRELRSDRDQLAEQLVSVRGEVATAGSRARAVSRQLAELQTQYAAVSDLRRRYDDLRVALGERLQGGEDVGAEVQDVLETVAALHADSERLREELDATRTSLANVDPAQTPAGQRMLYLTTSMIVMLLVVIVILIGAIRELG